MVKKILAVVLALALCLCACFGCGTKSDDSDATQAPAATDAQEDEKLGESKALLAAPTLSADFTVAEDFKIGFICLHDENSTYDNNFIKAAKAIKELLNLTDEQCLIKTNIPEGNECYEAACELADNGCDIVFADSFGHESYMIQAAEKYPDVEFCHATGTSAGVKQIANFHNAFASIYEGRYCAGIAAGMKLNEMISEGKITEDEAVIGYVGAFTYAEVISGMTSFYLGAKSVCPSVTMKVRYTGSWYDQALEAEAAEALISEDKCVLISQHADSLGAPSVCETKGVPNVSYNGSTYEAGPNTFIISSAINWQVYYLYIIKCVCTDTAIDYNWCGGISEGSVVLSGINLDVEADGTEEKINEAIAAFKEGTLHVFDTSTFTVTTNKTDACTVDEEGHLTAYLADVDGDYTGETNVIHDGYFDESGADFRSAPYFDIIIDGVENINTNFG